MEITVLNKILTVSKDHMNMGLLERAEAEIQAVYSDESLTVKEQSELVRDIEKNVQEELDLEEKGYYRNNNIEW